MKKLNKKGFTLIELLAVIVILAIIVVVTVPTILNSIEDSRRSALNSLAKEIANWYDTSYAHDMLAIGNDKILNGVHLDHTTGSASFKCLKDIDLNQAGLQNLAEKYGLSEDDFLLDYYSISFENGDEFQSCSYIKLVKGRAQVVLFGKEGGKFGKMVSDDYSPSEFHKNYVSAELLYEYK